MTRRLPIPELFHTGAAQTGEGPVIDHRTNELLWVDIPAGELYRADLSGKHVSSTRYPTMLSAVAPRRSDSGWAAAVTEGFAFLAGENMTVVDRVLPGGNRRMNDAKCDARGRFWAGSAFNDFRPGGGALHCWDGRDSRTVLSGLTLPNGLGWSPDGATMYLVDSIQKVVYRASFDVDSGTVGVFQPLFTVDEGLPDGLCVADDGSMWVAVWGGAQVQRRAPDGRLLSRLPTPVTQPSSCALSDAGVIYITSARGGLTPAALAEQPLAGSVFAATTGLRPVPVKSFAL